MVIKVNESISTNTMDYSSGIATKSVEVRTDSVTYVSEIKTFSTFNEEVKLRFIDDVESRVRHLLDFNENGLKSATVEHQYFIANRDCRITTTYKDASSLHHTEPGKVKYL